MQFDRGISWSRKDEGGAVAVLRIPNIEEGHINLDDLKYIDPKNGNGELDKNDIVMVASNGNPDLVGRSALVTEKEVGMRFASFLVRLRLDNTKLLSHYAHLFLLTPNFKRELRRKIATTSGIYNLRKEHVEKIEIPIPPLAIQKQIVERLDKIAEAQKLNDELIKKTDELFQSLLHKELNPAGKDWEVKKLNEVGEIITGTTPSTKNREYWNGEFLWATPTDIKENTFVLMDTPKKLSRGGYERTRPVPKNAILVTCIASIGKMAIAGKEMATNQQINSIVCNKNSDPFFVFFSLQKDKKKLISLGKTTAVPIINKSEFGRIKIFLPPLEIQKQIVTKLSTVQNYKKQLLGQKLKLKELFDSALAKSFKK
ncbi:MAG: restriction endonuclease subunit S [Candidatus Gastranaerophilales bacterium]|nr:restriction endonuclease subunit S [Candidatus Gastranaerophilales bacterium]